MHFFYNMAYYSGTRTDLEDQNIRQGDGDDVRPPLPVIRDVLYDNTMLFGYVLIPGIRCAFPGIVEC